MQLLNARNKSLVKQWQIQSFTVFIKITSWHNFRKTEFDDQVPEIKSNIAWQQRILSRLKLCLINTFK